jgi:outer membrane assembly lipoprotein YfiO
MSTLQSFVAAYPDSPLKPRAQQEIDKLTEWLAIKDYDTGMFYFRRKAYDPAIIYFKDVARLYPQTRHAELALIQLVRSYLDIRYTEEVAETCTTLHQKYPKDGAVTRECGTAKPAPVDSTPKP